MTENGWSGTGNSNNSGIAAGGLWLTPRSPEARTPKSKRPQLNLTVPYPNVVRFNLGQVGGVTGLASLVLGLLVFTAFRCSPRKSPRPIRSAASW